MKKAVFVVLVLSLHPASAEERREWSLSYAISSVWGSSIDLRLESNDRSIVAKAAGGGDAPCSQPLGPQQFDAVDEIVQRLISLRPTSSSGRLLSSCLDAPSVHMLVSIDPQQYDPDDVRRPMLAETFSLYGDCRTRIVPKLWLETANLVKSIGEEALAECRNSAIGEAPQR